MSQQQGAEIIAIVNEGDAYSQDLANLMKKAWTDEGNTVAENAASLVGTSYGTAGNPLLTRLTSATMIDNGGTPTRPLAPPVMSLISSASSTAICPNENATSTK